MKFGTTSRLAAATALAVTCGMAAPISATAADPAPSVRVVAPSHIEPGGSSVDVTVDVTAPPTGSQVYVAFVAEDDLQVTDAAGTVLHTTTDIPANDFGYQYNVHWFNVDPTGAAGEFTLHVTLSSAANGSSDSLLDVGAVMTDASGDQDLAESASMSIPVGRSTFDPASSQLDFYSGSDAVTTEPVHVTYDPTDPPARTTLSFQLGAAYFTDFGTTASAFVAKAHMECSVAGGDFQSCPFTLQDDGSVSWTSPVIPTTVTSSGASTDLKIRYSMDGGLFPSGAPLQAGPAVFSMKLTNTDTGRAITAESMYVRLGTQYTENSAYSEMVESSDGEFTAAYRPDDLDVPSTTPPTWSSVDIDTPSWEEGYDQFASPLGVSHGVIYARDSSGVLWRMTVSDSGALGSRTRVGPGWNQFSLITGARDMSGSGYGDLVARDKEGRLWFYRGTGDASAPFAKKQLIGNGGWNSMTQIVGIGHVTPGGPADLVARDTSGTLWLYPVTPNGKGGVTMLKRIRIGGGWNYFPRLVGMEDFNGDAYPDLVAIGPDGRAWLYAGTGKTSAPFAVRKQIKPGYETSYFDPSATYF